MDEAQAVDGSGHKSSIRSSVAGSDRRPPYFGDPARAAVVGAATAVAVGVLAAVGRWSGLRSRRFAVALVWVPMTWLGTISRVVPPRLPDRVHALAGFERDGARLYELLGVRVVKAALRRGPIAVFNPKLHLPSEPTPERVAELDRHMRTAEASHALLFVATLGLAGAARLRGWRTTARWTLVTDVALNGYPVMLQRYNRAILARRYGGGAAMPAPADGLSPPRR